MPVKKSHKPVRNKGGRPRISEDKREIARRLRIEEKKSFPEISRLTGLNRTTVQSWALQEGWPDPQLEQQELRTVLKQYSGPVGGAKPKRDFLDGLDLPHVDLKDAKITELGEQLFRWSATVLMSAGKFNLDAVKKVADMSTKIVLANEAPQEIRTLTIMTPPVTEIYRDPPKGDDRE